MTQEQKQNYERIYKLVIDLQKKYWPYEGEKDKNQALSQVINFAQSSLDKTLDPTDLKKFLRRVAKEILEELSKPLEQEAPSIPPNLKDFVVEMDEARAREEARREKLMAEAPRETYNYFFNLNKKIISQNYPKLPPTAIDEVSREITKDIIDKLPAVARPDLLKPEDYRQTIDKNLIAEKLKNAGLEPKENISQELLGNFSAARKIAAEPEIIKLIKEESFKIEKAPLSEEIPPLSQEILAQINQPQETVVFPNAYIFLHPKVTAAFFKKVISAPETGLIELAIENAPLDWQQDKNWPIIKEIVKGRGFAEDLQATVNWLKEKGLGEHPLTKKLEDKIYEFQIVQKNPKNNKDFPWVTRIKRNSYFDELLGRKKVTDPYLGYLPRLANEPIWSKKNSYGSSLQHGLDKFRFIPNTSQRLIRFITGGRYESIGILIRKTLYQKTIKPALIRLGKTATGKAAKNILIKFATGTAAKLGLGAATGGWSIIISSLPMIKNMAKKLLAFFAGLLIMAAHYGAAALVGGIAGIVGGAIVAGKVFLATLSAFSFLGWWAFIPATIAAIVTWIVTAIAGTAIGIGIQMLIDKVKNFFSNFSIPEKIASASSKIAAGGGNVAGTVVLTTIGTTAIGALMITQITASAFIIPEPEELEGSPYIQLTKTGDFAGNNETGEGTITYTITVGAKDETLINIKTNDKFSTHCRGDNPQINPEITEKIPESIEVGNQRTIIYTIGTDSSFKDCLVINQVNVTAEIASNPGETHFKTVSAVIVIGDPPDDCPYGWPTTGGITSLPGDPRPNNRIHQGIDIANDEKTPIYTTHTGAARLGEGGNAGYYVKVTGSCDKIPFETSYLHLLEQGRKSGEASQCDQIGLMGSTGYSSGPHLHYEIQGLGKDWWMNGKYFPKPEKGKEVTSSCP